MGDRVGEHLLEMPVVVEPREAVPYGELFYLLEIKGRRHGLRRFVAYDFSEAYFTFVKRAFGLAPDDDAPEDRPLVVVRALRHFVEGAYENGL